MFPSAGEWSTALPSSSGGCFLLPRLSGTDITDKRDTKLPVIHSAAAVAPVFASHTSEGSPHASLTLTGSCPLLVAQWTPGDIKRYSFLIKLYPFRTVFLSTYWLNKPFVFCHYHKTTCFLGPMSAGSPCIVWKKWQTFMQWGTWWSQRRAFVRIYFTKRFYWCQLVYSKEYIELVD